MNTLETELDVAIKEFTERHEGMFQHNAQHLGAEQAERNLPLAIGDNLSARVGPISVPYQGMISELHERVPVLSLPGEALADKTHVEATTSARDQDAGILQEANRKLRIDLGRINITFPWKAYWRVQVARLIILIGEAFYNSVSFQILRGPLIAALVLAIGTAVATAWWARFIPDYIARGRTPQTRRQRARQLVAFTCAVFLGLGYLRLAWIRQMNPTVDDGPWFLDAAPWVFMIINVFFVAVLVAIEMRFSPSKQDRVDREKQVGLERKIAANQRLIDGLVEQNVAERNGRHESWKASHRLLIRVKAFEQRIKDWRDAAIARYKEENTLKRSDGLVPTCFSQELTPLKGKLDNIKL